MRYQNPLFALPVTPKSRLHLAPESDGDSLCKELSLETAVDCKQCQTLAHDVRKLVQEKQELMADLINANQAFIRLQADHTALLQKVSGTANLPAQQKQQLCADASGVQDISTAAHGLQHKAAPAGLDLSTMVTNLLKPEGPASPAAAAAAAAVAEEDTSPVEGLGTPRLEPGSSPVKRQRKRWSQTAPLRNSLKSLGSLLSTRSSSSGAANILAPRSPKGIPTPRSPTAFSRFRASIKAFPGSSSSSGGNRFEAVADLAATNRNSPIIDVAALTHINTRSSSAAGMASVPRGRSSSGGSTGGSNCFTSSSSSSGAAGLVTHSCSSSPKASTKLPGRSSVDCSGAATFVRTSSSGMGSSAGGSKASIRRSVDSAMVPAAARPTGPGYLAMKLGLSVRTRHSSSSSSLLSGRFSHDVSCSPTAASSDSFKTAGADLQAVRHSAAPTTEFSEVESLAQYVNGHPSSSTGGGGSASTTGAAAATSVHAVPATPEQTGSSSSSVGGCDAGAACVGLPPVSSQMFSRYLSAQSNESGGSCDSHRLSNNSWSEGGTGPTANPATATAAGATAQVAAMEAAVTAAPASDKAATSSSSSNMQGGSAVNKGFKPFRPSHLRPMSPKSTALKDLASPLSVASSPAAAMAAIKSPLAAAAIPTEGTTTPGTATATATAATAGTASAPSTDLPTAAEPVTGPATALDVAAEPGASEPPPAQLTSPAAAAVAELLQPFSTPSSSKVKFLCSRKSSKQSPIKAFTTSTVLSLSPKPCFGRVWDKWSKARPGLSLCSGTAAEVPGLEPGAVEAAAAIEAAAVELGLLASSADAAAAAGLGHPTTAAAGSVRSRPGSVTPAGLGPDAAGCEGAPVGIKVAAAVGGSGGGRSGEEVVAWPLDFGAEWEYEAAGSLRPSVM